MSRRKALKWVGLFSGCVLLLGLFFVIESLCFKAHILVVRPGKGVCDYYGEGSCDLITINENIFRLKLRTLFDSIFSKDENCMTVSFPQLGVERHKINGVDSVSIQVKMKNNSPNGGETNFYYQGREARMGDISEGLSIKQIFEAYGPAPDIDVQYIDRWVFYCSGIEYCDCYPTYPNRDYTSKEVKRALVLYPTMGMNFRVDGNKVSEISLFKPCVYDDYRLRRQGISVFRLEDRMIDLGVLRIRPSDDKNFSFVHKFKNDTGETMLFECDALCCTEDKTISITPTMRKLENESWMYLMLNVRDMKKRGEFELALPFAFENGDRPRQILIKGIFVGSTGEGS